MNGPDLIQMFEYDDWATHKLLDAVAKLEVNAFEKDLGTSFRSLRGTLTHMYGAQRLWLDRWKGSKPTKIVSAEEIPTIHDLKKNWEDLYAELRSFLRSLTDDQIQNPFAYHDMRGNPWSEPLYQQIEHLAFHTMYHRGQVVTLLRQLGQTPPQTDLIVYHRSRLL
jgi:uncharacterized damage-inducible protein DinB